ncbi:lipoprotein signal peptidase [Aegicerativicinus sediminis]|uniref:lipoprotein signal peptidase n=1 Tax=Aegicerativicinus sediminis TaxID=2893202 RepID=UPI001E56250B|nr:lipoprotein signal peptidase [Aegicerativicinus sediminis]
MSLTKSSLLIVLILVIDQVSKVYVKTHFALNDGFVVFDWFKILFVENDGMAWGTKISDLIPIITDQSAKLFLTLFRIIAVFGIGIWLGNSIKNGKTSLLIIAISLILAGALGNIIDSVFYGIIFNDSHGQIATFLPEGGGYSSLFHGKVVDMLYFPIWKGAFPYWMPFVGGEMFTFFNPVFNIADMAISTGIGMLIFFNKAAFRES